MLFGHIHSTKEKLYGLFNLHVQLDVTIGEKVNCKSNFTELNAKCRSIYLGISLDLHILGILMNDVILLLPS